MLKPVSADLITFCQKIIANPQKVAILDTETSGLKGELLDLAVIDPNGNVLYNSLLKPRCPIEESAKAVHHIDEAMVSSAPTFADEWPKIYDAIRGRIIIAYNAKFDYERFVHTARVHNVSLPNSTWQCLMLPYACHWNAPPRFPDRPEPAWQKLEYACQQQGINTGEQKHRALCDTLITLALIKRIAQLGPATRKYCEAPEPWPSMIGIDEILSKQQPQQQGSALPGESNVLTTNLSESQCGAKQKTSRDLGTCCIRGCNKPAIYLSPSGNLKSVYCQQHGQSKCGVHTIEDFVFDNKRGIWLDPCVVDKEVIKDAKQQSLSLVS